MGRTRNKEWAREYFDRWGFWPICGGSGEDDEPDGDDENEDSDDDETDDDEDDSKNRKSQDSKSRSFSQDEVNRFVQDRVKSAKRTAHEAGKAEARREIEMEQAKKNKNFERQLELANKELEELRPLKDAVLQFAELAEKRYESTLATLPDFIVEMAPGEEADALTKEHWLTTRAIPAAAKFAKQQEKNSDGDDQKNGSKDESKGDRRQQAQRGNAAPKPTVRTKSDEERLKAIRSNLRSSGSYTPM